MSSKEFNATDFASNDIADVKEFSADPEATTEMAPPCVPGPSGPPACGNPSCRGCRPTCAPQPCRNCRLAE